ncbi:hypothetical protein GH741_12570 [Aquibacillus halophilus]|uniref:Permease n=1 Tax=Aquibacillus halophilus TaxID=930132 RepID=A0A6A8DCV7_9BACI|nr:hypothetical protein [Aquibacillus halophilus]MRH43513.1 hypothetical protein [Aquibacillus halophilus]
MKEFELSFENKHLRIWFVVMIPALILTILLFIFLPSELQYLPIWIPIITISFYWGWVIIKEKQNKTND